MSSSSSSSSSSDTIHVLPNESCYLKELEKRVVHYNHLMRLSGRATADLPEASVVEVPEDEVFSPSGEQKTYCYRIQNYVGPESIRLENDAKVLCEIEHESALQGTASGSVGYGVVWFVLGNSFSDQDKERIVQQFAVARSKECDWISCRHIATRRCMVVVQFPDGTLKQYGTQCFAHVFRVNWRKYRPALLSSTTTSSCNCTADSIRADVDAQRERTGQSEAELLVDAGQAQRARHSTSSSQLFSLSLDSVIREYCTDTLESSLRCSKCNVRRGRVLQDVLTSMANRVFHLVMFPANSSSSSSSISYKMDARLATVWRYAKQATSSALPSPDLLKNALDGLVETCQNTSLLCRATAIGARKLCDSCASKPVAVLPVQQQQRSSALGTPVISWTMTIHKGRLVGMYESLPAQFPRSVPLEFSSDLPSRSNDSPVYFVFEDIEATHGGAPSLWCISVSRDLFQSYRGVLRTGSSIALSVWRATDGSVTRVSLPF